MTDLTPSRRNVIAALAAFPILAAPAPANDVVGDEHILAAWDRAVAACDAIDFYKGELTDETLDKMWWAIEVERKAILTATATTLRGVETQLWCAAWEQDGEIEAEYAKRQNLEALEAEDLSMPVGFIVAALRSLRTMGA
jgi:hypothetical protein